MAVGKSIKLFRVNAGLKQKDLAEKLNIRVQYLCSVENEKKEPSLSLLKKIAEELNVPISMFFWEAPNDNKDNVAAKLKDLMFELTKAQTHHAKSS